jgi:hypothetical protein
MTMLDHIYEYKKRPILWDCADFKYKSINNITQAWKEITD